MVDIEKRRYKITGFRELDNNTVRVILTPHEIIKQKHKVDPDQVMADPFGFANQLMANQMGQMVHDTFLISRKEYMNQKYMVGDIVIVTIEKE